MTEKYAYVRRDASGYWSFDWLKARTYWGERRARKVIALLQRWWGG